MCFELGILLKRMVEIFEIKPKEMTKIKLEEKSEKLEKKEKKPEIQILS